jgi:hypothetical protein
VWAHKPPPAVCGEPGADVKYSLPRLEPFQVHSHKVVLRYTSGALMANSEASMRIFVDSRCGGTRGKPALPSPAD